MDDFDMLMSAAAAVGRHGSELAAVHVDHRVRVLQDDLTVAQCRLPLLLSKHLDMQPMPWTVHAVTVDDTSSEAVDDRTDLG